MLGLNVFYHLILLALLKRVWFNHMVSILAFPGRSQFHIFYCISKHVFFRPYIPIWEAKILVSIFNCKSSVNWNVYWTRNSTPGLWDCASKCKYLIYALKEVFLYHLCVTSHGDLSNKVREFTRVNVGQICFSTNG